MQYDIIIIGAGPGGIFSAYELLKNKPELKIGVFEAGAPLENVQFTERTSNHVSTVNHVPS